MLEDALQFSETWDKLIEDDLSVKNRAMGSLVRYIEKKLGVTFYIPSPFRGLVSESLVDLFALAKKLEKGRILKSLGQAHSLPDEPPLFAWIANLHREFEGEANASGAHPNSHRAALTATLAESVERYVWFEETDYFDSPTFSTTASIASRGRYIDPKMVAGPSATARTTKGLHIEDSSVFKWIRGYSWTAKKPLWLPAQLISGSRKEFYERAARKEPLIRSVSTNGLATRQTREGAVLYGVLELIERDAFMIMWLNQLTLPRFDIDDLCAQNASLAELVADCKKYRLKVDLIRMITDAPTYAVCAVVTDETENEPRVIVGLRAHSSKFLAAEKAILEALRIRQMTRHMIKHPPKNWSLETKADDIGHTDRLLYWATNNRSRKLTFLTKGPTQRFDEPWEFDTEDEHLLRIIDWCKRAGYEFASVSLTKSKKNISPWHIEMVVIPELQPIHLNEKLRHTGGLRLKEVPEMFGYKPIEPHTSDPHPFA
jgi:ribosomal protein S12 methylthiotransferase accessory factor